MMSLQKIKLELMINKYFENDLQCPMVVCEKDIEAVREIIKENDIRCTIVEVVEYDDTKNSFTLKYVLSSMTEDIVMNTLRKMIKSN